MTVPVPARYQVDDEPTYDDTDEQMGECPGCYAEGPIYQECPDCEQEFV